MLGTFIYALLDIGLNITVWTTKTISSGVYNGYCYFTGLDEQEEVKVKYTIQDVFSQINNQNECIENLRKEIIELKQLNNS